MITYRHFQFDNDGTTVIGIYELSDIIEDNPLLMYIPETYNNKHITFGWRYIDSEWLEPLQPTERDIISQEIESVTEKLHQIYEEEKFIEWLDIPNDISIQPFMKTNGVIESTNNVNLNNKEYLVQHLKTLSARLSEINIEKASSHFASIVM